MFLHPFFAGAVPAEGSFQTAPAEKPMTYIAQESIKLFITVTPGTPTLVWYTPETQCVFGKNTLPSVPTPHPRWCRVLDVSFQTLLRGSFSASLLFYRGFLCELCHHDTPCSTMRKGYRCSHSTYLAMFDYETESQNVTKTNKLVKWRRCKPSHIKGLQTHCWHGMCIILGRRQRTYER